MSVAVDRTNFIGYPSQEYHCQPLPKSTDPNELTGIYLNILYPSDKERIQQQKLVDWMLNFDPTNPASFPIEADDLYDISSFIMNLSVSQTIQLYSNAKIDEYCKAFSEKGWPDCMNDSEILEKALEKARECVIMTFPYIFATIQDYIPPFEQSRCNALREALQSFSISPQRSLEDAVRKINTLFKWRVETPWKKHQDYDWHKKKIELIRPPFNWSIRRRSLKQFVDKIMNVSSQDAPFFMALQEVTPEALEDLKELFKEKKFTWISYNNLTDRPTNPPRVEEISGESTGFTSTIALSSDLLIIKEQVETLPNVSGSVRKIMGIRVCHRITDQEFNIFTTHTDHVPQGALYTDTAEKISKFIKRFTNDSTSSGRFIFGGDLNAFANTNPSGGEFVEKLNQKIPMGSQDFRSKKFYAPPAIQNTTFIGRSDDPYATKINGDGRLDPNALDHLIAGPAIRLIAGSRDAIVYDHEGNLIDYFENPSLFEECLREKQTFSDHCANIVRFSLELYPINQEISQEEIVLNECSEEKDLELQQKNG